MKRILVLILAGFIVLALLAGCGGGSTTPESGAKTGQNTEKVVIGVYEPASGMNGAGGKQETLGIQYANYLTPTVEIGGKVYAVELAIADNESANDKAPSAAQTLIAEGSSLILGSYGSGVSIAASPTFEAAGIAAIGVTCTNPQVTLGNSHYFRICFLDPFQGPVLANLAKSQFNATKAYVLAELGDDYSSGLAHYFMEAFGRENCEYEEFPKSTSDYSTYVNSAKARGCDVFFSPTSTESAQLIIDQIATQGLNVPILAGDTWDSNVILEAAEGKNVEIFVTTFYQEGGAPEFDNGIKEWINVNPWAKENNGGNDKIAAVTAMGFDAYYMALEALKAAGSTDPGDILAVLSGVTYANGVSGAIAFDGNGDAVRDTAFVKRCNTTTGDWEFVAQQGVK